MIFLGDTSVKTLIGFALGSLLSLGTMSALASGTNATASARALDDGVEVIVVTAKRPAVQPVAEPVEVIVVTAKRPNANANAEANVDRTPPAMPIVTPKLELAHEPLVIRL
jgi:hypothetical protein